MDEQYEIFFSLTSADFSRWEIYMPEDRAILGMNGNEYYYYEKTGLYQEGRTNPPLLKDDFNRLKKRFNWLKSRNKNCQTNRKEAILKLDSRVYEQLKGSMLVVITNLKNLDRLIHDNQQGLKLTFEEFVSQHKSE